jgi:hypothetical protein
VKTAAGELRDVHLGEWLIAAAVVVYFVVRVGVIQG